MPAIPPSASILDVESGELWDGPRLNAEIARRSARLAGMAVSPGDRVLIAHGGTPGFFADLYAVWRCGAVGACANPGLPPPELANLVDIVRPAAILSTQADEGTPAGGMRMTCLEGEGDFPVAVSVAADPSDPALILFTSGSTGTPKGVVHSFASLGSRIALNRRHIGDGAMARTLCVLPTHFGHGLIGNCLTPLAAGGALVLLTGNSMRAAASLGAVIDEHRIGFMSSVPSFWRMVLKMSKPPEGGTLRRVHVGSAPCPAELWREIARWSGTDDVVNMYGLTETANWVAGASAAEWTPEDGLVGRMWGGEAAVRDDHSRIEPQGKGEIVLRVPSAMSGYLYQPALTKAAFDGDWFRTGDIGSIDGSGVIRLTGRTGTRINRGGIKVHPEEAELALERHPAVAEACAFAVPDPLVGETVGVAVVIVDGATADQKVLAEWCRGQIRREAVPDRWHFLPEIPKNDRGKPDRRAVRTLCLEEKTTR